MLEVKDLSFFYDKKEILNKIDFKLEYGQLVSLLGANGAGKSTLFRCILQILENYKGEIKIDGKNIRDISFSQRAKKLAYIPQETMGVFNYSVEEIVLMSTTNQKIFNTPKKREFEIMKNSLERLKISYLRKQSFMEISGGERQLVLIARALAQNAKILLMDKPTSNLDFGNQIYLLQILKELSKEGYLIFLSTHNPDFALQYSDRVIILYDKKILANDKANIAITEKNLSKIYKNKIKIANIENTNKKTCIGVF